MKKVLIFDHSLKVTGHRLPYASLVADSFPECDVIVALAKQIQNEAAVKNYFPNQQVTYFEPADRPLGIAFARESARCLKQLVQSHDPDHTVIPTADGLATLLGFHQLFGGNRWLKDKTLSGCLMKGGWPQGNLPMIKKLVGSFKWWLMTKGPWTQLMLIDPRAWAGLGTDRDNRILLCPDPVPVAKPINRQSARRQLELPENGRLIVSLGNQDSRKGTDLLISAFNQANLNPDDRLLVLGKIEASTRVICDEFAAKPNLRDRLILKDEYVSEEAFQLAVLASDIVAAPYRKTQGPSGIVCRAIGWERPILASNSGWLQWVCDHLQVGTTVDVQDSELFAQAIFDSLESSTHYQPSDAARQFAQYNTKENYHRIWNLGVLETPSTTPFQKPEFLVNHAN